MRLFGSWKQVMGEGVEWRTETRRSILPFVSQQLCVLLQWLRLCWHLPQHASTNLCYSPGFYSNCSSPTHNFYKAAGVISECVNMSEHICWSKKVQTRCVSRMISQLLSILRKQSSSRTGFICLTPVDRLHQSNGVTVYLTCWILQKDMSEACKLCLWKHICPLCSLLEARTKYLAYLHLIMENLDG